MQQIPNLRRPHTPPLLCCTDLPPLTHTEPHSVSPSLTRGPMRTAVPPRCPYPVIRLGPRLPSQHGRFKRQAQGKAGGSQRGLRLSHQLLREDHDDGAPGRAQLAHNLQQCLGVEGSTLSCGPSTACSHIPSIAWIDEGGGQRTHVHAERLGASVVAGGGLTADDKSTTVYPSNRCLASSYPAAALPPPPLLLPLSVPPS